MTDNQQVMENRLIECMQKFLLELDIPSAHNIISTQSQIEKDLGIGSIERAELFRRIEKEFTVQFAAKTLGQAETVQDILAALIEAKPILHRQERQYAPKLEEIHLDVSKAKTLNEVLFTYAEFKADRPHIYLQDEAGNEKIITYGGLFDSATTAAEGFIAKGLKPGETVAIMLPTGEDFFITFFGILLAGGIPVPIYPPFRANQIEEYITREAKILSNAEVRFLITFAQVEKVGKMLQAFIPSLKEVMPLANVLNTKGELPTLTLDENDSALIQYTSGSTAAPKGVLLSHANLLANIRAYGKALNLQPSDSVVSWLPLYHDMGLIGSWLGSLYHGLPLTIMSPLDFLSHPERWLWTIHYHRATLSAGPNFAYELCIHKIEDSLLEGLDLSSWRSAFDGAEAVYPHTLRNFAQRFAKYGFKAEACKPVFGLAESSVALTIPREARIPLTDKVQRDVFDKKQIADPVFDDKTPFHEFVCCGKPLDDHEIRIVDAEGNALTERHVGMLQFRGPSAMQGYYRNPEATQAVFHSGWWDTGDLAYIADNELYITGRKKDLIIKAGRNLYPAGIEEILGDIENLRRGCIVAFGVNDPEKGTEKFVIVAETQTQDEKIRSQIMHDINNKLISSLGMPADQIVLVAPKTIPKTSSGKLRRDSCKQDYLSGKLNKKHQATWLQIGKIFIQSKLKTAYRWLPNIAKLFYGIYITLVLFLLGLPLILSSYFLSKEKLAFLMKKAARLLFILGFCPVQTTGLKNLTQQKPCIYIANHCSYLDALFLIAFLPEDVLYIGKKELVQAPIIGKFFKKLGYISVDREDFAQSIEDTNTMLTSIQQGHSIFIFPEGTFTYATGLRPFKLGAFKIAVETNTPLCPIALAGTRYVLRSGHYLPRPRKLKFTVGELLFPRNQEWQEVIHLRSEARKMIAEYCGEKTLDLIG